MTVAMDSSTNTGSLSSLTAGWVTSARERFEICVETTLLCAAARWCSGTAGPTLRAGPAPQRSSLGRCSSGEGGRDHCAGAPRAAAPGDRGVSGQLELPTDSTILVTPALKAVGGEFVDGLVVGEVQGEREELN